MKVKFTKQSIDDINSIYRYILQQSDRGIALKIIHKIKNAIDSLNKHAYLGRKVKTNSRRLTIPSLPFVVVYKIDNNRNIIYIVTIFHTAKRI